MTTIHDLPKITSREYDADRKGFGDPVQSIRISDLTAFAQTEIERLEIEIVAIHEPSDKARNEMYVKEINRRTRELRAQIAWIRDRML